MGGRIRGDPGLPPRGQEVPDVLADVVPVAHVHRLRTLATGREPLPIPPSAGLDPGEPARPHRAARAPVWQPGDLRAVRWGALSWPAPGSCLWRIAFLDARASGSAS